MRLVRIVGKTVGLPGLIYLALVVLIIVGGLTAPVTTPQQRQEAERQESRQYCQSFLQDLEDKKFSDLTPHDLKERDRCQIVTHSGRSIYPR